MRRIAFILGVFAALTVLWADKRSESFPASRTVYGLTYDGTNFWYSDPSERSLVRIGPTGRPQRFPLGTLEFRGMAFNTTDGFLYVASERKILRVNTVTGGLDQQIPVPVASIAGIGFGPNAWYLLEKDTGIVHFFDPKLLQVVSTFRTKIETPFDITVHRGNIWLSDGKHGILYRFSPETQKLTGSVRGPIENLRGVTFAEGQLWMANREKAVLERLPYTETERYIASGEKKYTLKIKITFTSPAVPARYFIAMTPPNTESQRARNIAVTSPGWKFESFTASGEKVFTLPATLPGTNNTLEYEAAITAQNVRFLLPNDYSPPDEKLEGRTAAYFMESESDFQKARVKEVLARFLKTEKPPANGELAALLQKNGVPARTAGIFIIQNAKAVQKSEAQAYLRNFGWVPVSVDKESDLSIFERRDDTVELFRQPDIQAQGLSPIYAVAGEPGGARKMTSVPATVEVNVEVR